MLGVHDRILDVNLSTGSIETIAPGEQIFRTYLGGSSLAVHYLLKDHAYAADPLGAENILAIMAGPPVGTPIGGFVRTTMAACSPFDRWDRGIRSRGLGRRGIETRRI